MATLIALVEHPVLQRPGSTRIFWAEALEITPDVIRYRERGSDTETGFVRTNHRNHPPTGAFILDA